MRIGGILDVSTKDIPNKCCMVIFTVGCNLNCSFCHNKHLLEPKMGRNWEINEIIEFVKSNFLVDSISITGGEPTLQNDLLELCKEIQKLGKYINIDTNGTNPHIIENLVPYINRISLDLKSPLKKTKYREITNSIVNPKLIIETFNIINNNLSLDFEIRTTYVENLMLPEDIHKIVNFLKGNKFRGQFVLQQYQYSDGVGEKYKEIYHIPEHMTLLNILKKYKKKNLTFEIFVRDKVVGYKNIDEIQNYLE